MWIDSCLEKQIQKYLDEYIIFCFFKTGNENNFLIVGRVPLMKRGRKVCRWLSLV